MPTALKHLKIDRVSLVDRPANPEAIAVLAKRDDSDDEDVAKLSAKYPAAEDTTPPKPKGAGPSKGGKAKPYSDRMSPAMVSSSSSDEDDDEDDASSGLGDGVGKAAKPSADDSDDDTDDDQDNDADDEKDVEKRDFSAADRKRMAASGAAMGDGSFPIANTEDLHNAVQAIGRAKNPDAARRHIISRAKAMGMTSALPDSWNVSKADTTNIQENTDMETVTKADLDAIRKQYEDQLATVSKSLEETTARAIQAETVAKAEQDRRETREAIAKAERDYPMLPGTTPADTGTLLRELGKVAPTETIAKLEAVLKAASVVIARGDLFAEHGQTGSANADSPVAKLEAVAKGLRTSDTKLTEAQAFTKAVELNPELASEYRQQFVPASGYRAYR